MGTDTELRLRVARDERHAQTQFGVCPLIRRPVSRVLSPGANPGATVIHLRPALRTAWCDLPGRHAETHVRRTAFVPIRSCSRWGLPSPLPCGRGGALLPHRFTLAPPSLLAELRRAVCSLLRFPWGHPRRTLSGTLSPWSPDFPRRHRFRPCRRDRPAA